jgi:hypothetical protein
VEIQPPEPGPSREPGRRESGRRESGRRESGRRGSDGRESGRGWLTTGSCYVVLFLLGVAEAVIGSFQYSRGIGAFPAAAIGFALLVLVTCILAAWGMRAPTAALMPAVGWFAASFVLAMSTPGGSIVITNTAAGKWYLFGGAACAAAGVIAGFSGWSTARIQRQGLLTRPAGRPNTRRQFAARQNARRPRKPGL